MSKVKQSQFSPLKSEWLYQALHIVSGGRGAQALYVNRVKGRILSLGDGVQR